jgi:hypothetical protein
MPLVRRRLGQLLSVFLIVVAVGVLLLWARSYFVQDLVTTTCGTRHVGVGSCAGTLGVLWDVPGAARHFELDWVRKADAEPVAGSYAKALVRFDVGSLPWGITTIVYLPHWSVIGAAAAWPVVRTIRRRRRAATGGFPLDAATRPAPDAPPSPSGVCPESVQT